MNRFPWRKLSLREKQAHLIKARTPNVVNRITAATTKERADITILVNSV
jgi:hypothetical protein